MRVPPPPSSLGHPPSAQGHDVVLRARRLIEADVLPLIAATRRPSESGFAVADDGRLSDDVRALKMSIHQAAADAGVYCAHLPTADGGLGLSLVDCFHVQEEVYRYGLGGAQWVLGWTDGPSPLVSHWSPAAREQVLPAFAAGRISVVFAITEPGAGSDALGLTTTARRDGNGWRLTGTKHLITGAPFAAYAQVVAREEGADRRALTMFLVPLDAPGVHRGPVQQTIMADGQTGVLEFRDVHVPASAVVGEVGGGLRMALCWINWARTRRGGMCSGLAWHCLARSRHYCREREAFGASIGQLGAVAQMLSDMYMDWHAMRALSLELLAGLDRADPFGARATPAMRRDVSTIKTWNDEALSRVVDRAIQIHGGQGLLTQTGLELIYRVARNLRIPAGTTEVQRATIAEALLRDDPA